MNRSSVYDEEGRKLCNTFGCTLLNNHRGLHALPSSDQSRASRKRPKALLEHSSDVSFEESERDCRVTSAGAQKLGPQPQSQSVAQCTGGSFGKASTPEQRPMTIVPGLCKKVPHCQRFKNHPGLCKTPVMCHKTLRCTKPFGHGGPCRVPPPCHKDARCGRAAGHSGICRILEADPVFFDKPMSKASHKEGVDKLSDMQDVDELCDATSARGIGRDKDVPRVAGACASVATKSQPSAAVVAAASAVAARTFENAADAEGGDATPLDYGRCRKHVLCVRGARHPGLCRLADATAKPVHRILAKHTSVGRFSSLTQFLVQSEHESRAQAEWRPAYSVLDDASVALFEADLATLVAERAERRATGASLPSDAYDDQVLLRPPLEGEPDEPLPPRPPRGPSRLPSPSHAAVLTDRKRRKIEAGDSEELSKATDRIVDGDEMDSSQKDEEMDHRSVYDEQGRKLCNTFGCTLLNNHYGLHKLPEASEGCGRQRRTASKINFRKLASGATRSTQNEIGEGRQLGKPASWQGRQCVLLGSGDVLRARAGFDAQLAGREFADACYDDDAVDEAIAVQEERKPFGSFGGRRSEKSVSRAKLGIGARVRYLRAGSSYGCTGTIVDAKCGYWVISIDGGPRAPLFARGSMVEPIGPGAERHKAQAAPQACEVADERPDSVGNGDSQNEGNATHECTFCGRQLANAGSRANHERACTGSGVGGIFAGENDLMGDALNAGLFTGDVRNRAPSGGHCRRNPNCVRGLRHCGLGGPCRLRPPGSVHKPLPTSRYARNGGVGKRPAKQSARGDYGCGPSDAENARRNLGAFAADSVGKAALRKKSTVPGRVGHAMVGRIIEVYWAADRQWQEGRVLAYNPETGKHTVEYTRQGAREQLTLAREQWRQDEPSFEDDSDDDGEEAATKGEEAESDGEEAEEAEVDERFEESEEEDEADNGSTGAYAAAEGDVVYDGRDEADERDLGLAEFDDGASSDEDVQDTNDTAGSDTVDAGAGAGADSPLEHAPAAGSLNVCGMSAGGVCASGVGMTALLDLLVDAASEVALDGQPKKRLTGSGAGAEKMQALVSTRLSVCGADEVAFEESSSLASCNCRDGSCGDGGSGSGVASWGAGPVRKAIGTLAGFEGGGMRSNLPSLLSSRLSTCGECSSPSPPAVNVLGACLELAAVKPHWIIMLLTQMSPGQPRRRVKSLSDAWLGVHLTSSPIAQLGKALRCCPVVQLSPGGQLRIRQSDVIGLQEGLYQFALYSRHKYVACSNVVRVSRNRFITEIIDATGVEEQCNAGTSEAAAIDGIDSEGPRTNHMGNSTRAWYNEAQLAATLAHEARLAQRAEPGKHAVEYTRQGAREQLTLAREQWRPDEPSFEDNSEDDGQEGKAHEEDERFEEPAGNEAEAESEDDCPEDTKGLDGDISEADADGGTPRTL